VKLEVPLHRTRTFGVLKSWFAVAGGAGGKWRGFGTSRCRHPEKAVLQEEQADLSPISNTGTSPWFTIVIWPPTMRMGQFPAGIWQGRRGRDERVVELQHLAPSTPDMALVSNSQSLKTFPPGIPPGPEHEEVSVHCALLAIAVPVPARGGNIDQECRAFKHPT
jgi:hypothetical protein